MVIFKDLMLSPFLQPLFGCRHRDKNIEHHTMKGDLIMTTNQIAYFSAVEQKRHNLATEEANLQSVSEARRHNLASENLTLTDLTERKRNNIAVLSETARHNQVMEKLGLQTNAINAAHYERSDKESARHNLATETESVRHNNVVERETERNNRAYLSEVGRHNLSTEALQKESNAIASENAATARQQAETARKQAETAARHAAVAEQQLAINAASVAAQHRQAQAALQNAAASQTSAAAALQRANVESELLDARKWQMYSQGAVNNASVEKLQSDKALNTYKALDIESQIATREGQLKTGYAGALINAVGQGSRLLQLFR